MIANWGWFDGIVMDVVDGRLGRESDLFMVLGAALRNYRVGSRGKSPESKNRNLYSGSLRLEMGVGDRVEGLDGEFRLDSQIRDACCFGWLR